jgi:hypothetical protein
MERSVAKEQILRAVGLWMVEESEEKQLWNEYIERYHPWAIRSRLAIR